MAQELNDTDDKTQRIKQDLEDTRSSISNKLEALQDRMKDTVDSTRHTVEETVQSVKETVTDTLHSIKEAFDIKHQARKHPWTMMGTAIFIGVFVAHLSCGRRNANEKRIVDGAAEAARQWSSPQPVQPAAASAPPKPSLKERLAAQFHDEITRLQSVAIGAGAGILRDWLKRTMPSLASKIEEVIDSATTKMGGEPIPGPVFRRGHNGHDEDAD